MKHDVLQQADKYVKARQRKRRWYRVVTCLACVVVFCTTYALILPAITLEDQFACGLEEHTHTEACYTQVTAVTRTKPICTIESLNLHEHAEDCYDADGELICGYADFVVHQHVFSCYDENGNLWCPLREIETHAHGESCFSVPETVHTHTDERCTMERVELICQLEESSDHQHTDNCYIGETVLTCELPTESADESEAAEPELICNKEEIILHEHISDCFDETGGLICGMTQVLEHVHSDACFRTVVEPVDTEALTCTLPEDENHTHTALCYGVWELTCGLEEHTHSEECRPASGLTREDQARVDEVIALIDALPTLEEVEETLTAYEEAGDMEGCEAYYKEVRSQSVPVYINYEAMAPSLQELVTNRDKLLEMEWLWSAMTYEATDTVNVTAVNSHNYCATIIYHSDSGMSVGDNTSGEKNYNYWTAVVVEYENGRYVVKQIVSANGTSKSSLWASGNGFILLYHQNNVNASVNVSVGDTATLSGDFWKTMHSYTSGTVYGTVSFGSVSAVKPEKDNSSKLNIVKGADTRDLIEVNLYDYDSSINTPYQNNNKYPGFQQDNGSTQVGSSFNPYSSFNFGNNITMDLSAGIAGVTNAGGAINATTNGANSPISGAMLGTLGSDGQPALVDGTSLGYLFSNSDYATKKNRQSINGLFQYNETTGAYTFNSRENHAQFDSTDDTFTLYRQIISSNFVMYPFGNFLPFNDIVKLSAQTSTIDRAYLQTIVNSAQSKYNQGAGAEYGTLATQLNQFISLMDSAYGTSWTASNAMNKYFELSGISRTFTQDETLLQNLYSIDYDEPTDFFFGMEMKMNFIQPKGGITGPNNDQDMVFYFTGDDDVWVYIDGVLFLDLSGIHRHVGGEIDFVNGVVKYYDLDVSTGDVSTEASKTVNFSNLVDESLLNENGTYKDYTTHSFNFYYMERGAGSGVCRMNFNFPLLRQNSISVTKELSVYDGDGSALLGNPDFYFQVLKADGDGNKLTDLFINADEAYNIYDSSNTLIGTGKTDANGVFTLKAGQRAEFTDISENSGKYYVRELLDSTVSEQYGTVSVDGTSQTTNYNNVTIGSDQFKGLDSTVKDMSDGSTAFHFNNQVKISKLGSLKITKKLETYPQTRTALQFQFRVTLDGVPLPIGTAYQVGLETRIVTEAGIITLGPDETAVLSNIIAGSRFTVQETAVSGAGYTVTYTGDGLKQESGENGPYVSGIIQTESAVAVTVTNSEGGTTVTIPGTKTLTNSDSGEHSFTFKLEQVIDSLGGTVVEGGISQTTSVTFPPESGENSADFLFSLNYLEKDITSLTATYYYKITEIAEDTGQVLYDPAVYIAEVTVVQENGELTATLTNLWKDGIAATSSTLSFTNTLVGDLTIGKQVKGDQNARDTEFSFTITLKQGDTPLSGSFNAVKTAENGDSVGENITVTFDASGCANIQLKHGERLKITGIPLGTDWTVTENGADSYSVSHQVNFADAESGGTGTGTITGTGATIIVTNSAIYVLPSTGGAGTDLYTVGGLLLSIGAGFLLLYKYIKRRKEDSVSS